MGISNNITATLNFIALLCSIPIITSGIRLASKPDNVCVHIVRWPVVVLGVLVLLVSLVGFFGAYWNKHGLLALYLFAMAVLISLLLIVLVFAFVVTRSNGSYHVYEYGRGYKEYRLDGFSEWLRNHVTDTENWPKIKACLAESDVCLKLTQNFVTADQFFMAHNSPLQTGCCKPPTACGFNYVNPTYWVNPMNYTNTMGEEEPDCYLWSNDQTQLCYNCNSCKAGLLQSLIQEWRKANLILIVAVVILISVYAIACSAFRNAQFNSLK